MEKFFTLIGVGLLSIILFAVVALPCAVPAFLLWNWLCPHLFNLPEITYWEAWGLLWLCSMLFKGNPQYSMFKEEDGKTTLFEKRVSF